MKYLLLITLAAIAAATEAAAKDLLAENIAHFLGMNVSDAEVCTREWNTKDNDIYYVQEVFEKERVNDDPVISERVSCAIHCCMEKKGLIKGRDLQINKFYELSSDTIVPPEVNARNIVRICKAQVDDVSDKCLVSFEFSKCVIRSLYEL